MAARTAWKNKVNNGASTVAGGGYVAGNGTLNLVAGFGAPTVGSPIELTCVHAANGAISILNCTARASNAMTITGAIEGTTDINLSAGDIVENRDTLGQIFARETAINALEAVGASVIYTNNPPPGMAVPVDGADLSAGSTTFTADALAALQAMLDQLNTNGGGKLIVNGRYTVSGMPRVHSNTTVEGLNPSYGWILATSANTPCIQNFNCQHSGGIVDKNITIRNLTFNHNAGTGIGGPQAGYNQALSSVGTYAAGNGYAAIVRMMGIDNLLIENVTTLNGRQYGIHVANLTNSITDRNCRNDFRPNSVATDFGFDGVHWNGPMDNCHGETFRGKGRDDSRAANADDGDAGAGVPFPTGGPITNCTWRDTYLDTTQFGNRWLSTVSNFSGNHADGIRGYCTRNIMLIDNALGIIPTPVTGAFGSNEISNVSATILGTDPANTGFQIGARHRPGGLKFNNIFRDRWLVSCPYFNIISTAELDYLVIDGFHAEDIQNNNCDVVAVSGIVRNLILKNFTLHRDPSLGVDTGCLVHLLSGADVFNLQLINCSSNLQKNLVRVEAGAWLGDCKLTQCEHVDNGSAADNGAVHIATGVTVPNLGISAFGGTTPLTLAGTGAVTNKYGDAFSPLVASSWTSNINPWHNGVEYYTLSTISSGNETGSIAGKVLNDNGTGVTAIAGGGSMGNVLHFPAASSRLMQLSVADSAILEVPQNTAGAQISFWLRILSNPSPAGLIIGKNDSTIGGGAGQSWICYTSTFDNQLTVSISGVTLSLQAPDTGGAFTTNVWYFVVMRADYSGAPTIPGTFTGQMIRPGFAMTAPFVSGSLPFPAINNGTTKFRIGTDMRNGFYGDFDIRGFTFSTPLPTQEEMIRLYNAGVPHDYPA
jgi:hypothetical protein